ncbi:hypothetical protein [Phenylobacterium sp.]|jgi:uncharacterized protein YecT (DUF1311 family)|uniref:hypothetical protein n=1 Tax=Phenylobacterium sp. TaxID=1871053 RepID=UPI002F94A31C
MQLDLSSLSERELRGLLSSAQGRGQAAQSYQILQELARRREAAPAKRGLKPRRGRRAAPEPRIIEIDLGDPLDRPDDTFDLPEPPQTAEALPNIATAAEPDPIESLTLAPEAFQAGGAPPRAPRVRRRGPPGAVIFTAGVSVGVAAGVALAIYTGAGVPAALTAAIGQPAQLLKASTPAPAPVAAAPLPAESEPAPTAELAAVDPAAAQAPAAGQLDIVLASPDAAGAAQDAAAVPPPPEPPTVEEERVAEATGSEAACDGATTPADRTICQDPALQKLQRRLREAYAQALDAHAEKSLLRQRQLAWREARNGVTDRARLAALYEARIRKLQAAAADARRHAD